MGSESKENKLLELFFNNPTKHWHFEGLIRKSKVSRSKTDRWLTKFVAEGLVKRIKPKNHMPYYKGNFEHHAYKIRKKLYALNELYKTGFWNHLISLPKAKAVILFGSFTRSDWYSDSDIDLFIYGDDDKLDTSIYCSRLRREIQVFTAKNMQELQEFGPGLLRNIIEGIILKGKIDFIEVTPVTTVKTL